MKMDTSPRYHWQEGVARRVKAAVEAEAVRVHLMAPIPVLERAVAPEVAADLGELEGGQVARR